MKQYGWHLFWLFALWFIGFIGVAVVSFFASPPWSTYGAMLIGLLMGLLSDVVPSE